MKILTANCLDCGRILFRSRNGTRIEEKLCARCYRKYMDGKPLKHEPADPTIEKDPLITSTCPECGIPVSVKFDATYDERLCNACYEKYESDSNADFDENAPEDDSMVLNRTALAKLRFKEEQLRLKEDFEKLVRG